MNKNQVIATLQAKKISKFSQSSLTWKPLETFVNAFIILEADNNTSAEKGKEQQNNLVLLIAKKGADLPILLHKLPWLYLDIHHDNDPAYIILTTVIQSGLGPSAKKELRDIYLLEAANPFEGVKFLLHFKQVGGSFLRIHYKPQQQPPASPAKVSNLSKATDEVDATIKIRKFEIDKPKNEAHGQNKIVDKTKHVEIARKVDVVKEINVEHEASSTSLTEQDFDNWNKMLNDKLNYIADCSSKLEEIFEKDLTLSTLGSQMYELSCFINQIIEKKTQENIMIKQLQELCKKEDWSAKLEIDKDFLDAFFKFTK